MNKIKLAYLILEIIYNKDSSNKQSKLTAKIIQKVIFPSDPAPIHDVSLSFAIDLMKTPTKISLNEIKKKKILKFPIHYYDKAIYQVMLVSRQMPARQLSFYSAKMSKKTTSVSCYQFSVATNKIN
jgi:hypothetical protein